MTRSLTVIIGGMLLSIIWNHAARAQADFDCSKAYLTTDYVICASPEAMAANNRHTVAWQNARARLDEEEKKALLADQRNWIKQYGQDCGVPGHSRPSPQVIQHAMPCVIARVETRTVYLDGYGRQPSEKQQPSDRQAQDDPARISHNSSSAVTSVSNGTCSLVNDYPDRGLDVRWSGECKDGQATGVGVARWYKDNIQNYEREYNRNNGLIRFQGKPQAVVDIIDKNITVTLATCDKIANYRVVHVDASPALAIDDRVVVAQIINIRGQTLAWQQCPSNDYSNVDVEVYVQGQNVIHARSYQPVQGPAAPYSTNWFEYGNDALQARINDRAREAASQAAQAKQTRRSDFTSAAGIQEYTKIEDIVANPFVFKNKVVAVYAEFSRMLSESEALFRGGYGGDIIATNVPPTRFRGTEHVVLVIKVKGTRTIKAAAGEVSTPDLQYVDVYFCQQYGCQDFYN